MSPETPADIARRVLALDAEATPEPWAWDGHPVAPDALLGDAQRELIFQAACDEGIAWDRTNRACDQSLIAAYRNDAPALARAYLALEDNAALLAEGAALLLARVESTEADNAALMEIAATAVSATANDEWRDRWMARLETEHPGDALLRELAVLRLLADAARRWDADLSEYCDGEPRDALRAAFAALEAQP